MSYIFIAMLAEKSVKRFGMQPFLGALEHAWVESAPRHRGVMPPWNVVVSLPPAHENAHRILEIDPTAASAIADWVCVILPDDALGFVSHGLTRDGTTFITSTWKLLEKCRPSGKFAIWIAMQHGSSHNTPLGTSREAIFPPEAIAIRPNCIIVLDDGPIQFPDLRADAPNVAIEINPSIEWRRALARCDGKDLHLLAGTVDILIDDWMATVGGFDGALLLWPSVDMLITAYAQLVALAPRIGVDLVGNGGAFSIVRQHNKATAMVCIVCERGSSPPVSARTLAAALAEAVLRFLRMLANRIPISQWPHDAVDVAIRAKRTWDRGNAA